MRKSFKSAILALVVTGAALIATGCGDTPDEERGYHTPDPGRITVVRGAPDGNSDVDDKGIQRVICPGEKRQKIGKDVDLHTYPEERSQRYYLITTDEGRGDRPTADYIEATTADGVKVRLEGKFYFQTAFSCNGDGEKLLRQFDDQFGARSFPLVGQGGTDSSPSAAPWDGSPGWDAFLDVNVRPDMDNVLPEQVGGYTCAQLNTACAVISNAKSGKALVDAEEGKASTAARQKLEEGIVEALNKSLEGSMGAPYVKFTDFQIARITLPTEVQKAVDDAQAEYAKLSGKEAELANARLEAEKQTLLSAAYEKSPALLQLEIAKIERAKFADMLKLQENGRIGTLNLYSGNVPSR